MGDQSVKSTLPSSKQTVKNIVYIWINRVLVVLAPLLTTPLIIKKLGIATTGVWLLSTQIAANLTLLDSGFATTLTRLLAQHRIKCSEDKAINIIYTAFWTLITFSFLLLLSSPLISNIFVKTFKIGSQNTHDGWMLILLTTVFVSLSLPLRCGYGLVASRHRFDIIQILDALPIFIRVVGILCLYYTENLNLMTLAFTVYVGNLVGLVFIQKKGLQLYYGMKTINPFKYSISAMRELYSLSISALIITSASFILLQGTPILIGRYLGTADVTILSIPIFIYVSITPFFQTFAAVLNPIAASASDKHEIASVRSFILNISRYLTSFSLIMSLLIYEFGEELLILWIGKSGVSLQNIHVMNNILTIIFIGHSLSAIAPLGRSLLSSTGYHWDTALYDIITSLIGFVGSFIMIYYYNKGAVGAAVGICIALIIRGIYIYPRKIVASIGVSYKDIMVSTFFAPLVIFCIVALLGSIAKHFFAAYDSANILTRIFVWIVPVSFWLWMTWRYVILREHQQKIGCLIKSKVIHS